MRGCRVGSEFVERPSEIKSWPRPRRGPYFFYARIDPWQQGDDQRVRAEKKTFLAMAPHERMPPDAFEVPSTSVKLDKDNQVGRFGICRQRMNAKPIVFGALQRFLQRRQIEIGLVIFRSSREQENARHDCAGSLAHIGPSYGEAHNRAARRGRL